jgi:hypothetical protein
LFDRSNLVHLSAFLQVQHGLEWGLDEGYKEDPRAICRHALFPPNLLHKRGDPERKSWHAH